MPQPPQPLLDYIEGSRLALTLADPSLEDTPLIHCNEPFLELTQRPREELIGKNCRVLQHGHHEQPALDKIRAYLASDDQRSLRVQLVNFRADGTPFINMLTLSRVCDERERTCYIFASQFDVSAASAQSLTDYERQLMDMLDRPLSPRRDHNLYILSSIQMVADAAATVAKARLTIANIEVDDGLF